MSWKVLVPILISNTRPIISDEAGPASMSKLAERKHCLRVGQGDDDRADQIVAAIDPASEAKAALVALSPHRALIDQADWLPLLATVQPEGNLGGVLVSKFCTSLLLKPQMMESFTMTVNVLVVLKTGTPLSVTLCETAVLSPCRLVGVRDHPVLVLMAAPTGALSN